MRLLVFSTVHLLQTGDDTMSKQVTISISDDQAARIEKLRTTTMAGERAPLAKSVQEQIYACIEKGLYAIEYTRKQYVAKKIGAAIYKQAQKDPEMAERYGLGTRATVGVAESTDDTNGDDSNS
jgi:hypothetical protein